MKRTFLLPLLALCAFAAAPAQAGWAPNGVNTDNNSDRPQITNGVWTLTLYSKKNIGYKDHVSGETTVLDLRDVNTDLAAAGSSLCVTGVDYRGFYQNTVVTEILLPEECTSFGEQAFQYCSSIETVCLSSRTPAIANQQLFSVCKNLKTVYYNGIAPVEGSVILPETVTSLKNNTFEMNSGNINTAITNVVMPGVTSIGTFCFQYCQGLVNVTATNVTYINNRAFLECRALKTVEFSPNLNTMLSNGTGHSDHAPFYNCVALESFSPSVWGPMTIEPGTFRNCNSLTNYFDLSRSGITAIPSMWAAYTALAGVTFPATLTAFTGDQNIRNLAKGAKFRFLGDRPTVTTTGDKSPFYTANKNNTNERHVFVVDAATYPAWTNGTDFVAMADIASNNDTKGAFLTTSADFPATKYPDEIAAEEVLGATIWGSGSGRYNWVVQYVDHSKFDVTWMNGAETFGATRVEKGFAPEAPAGTPAKASTDEFDYTFLGWNTDASATTALDLSAVTIAADTTFHAIYSATTRSYPITWEWDNGTDTSTDTTTVAYGGTPVHADPTKAGDGAHTYSFSGWSTDGATVLSVLPAVTGAATYIAVFEEHDASTTATVSWFDEDGTTALDPATTTVEKGAKPTHAEPAKAPTIDTAYTFDGWIEIGGDGSVIAPAALPAATVDVSYKAHYATSVRQYTVTFANWDGSVVSAIAYNYGTPAASVAVPATSPTRPATAEYTYTFTGWNPATVADVTADATYTAQYSEKANDYTATFVNGIDESEISHATFAFGAAVTTPEPPEVVGHHFTAWSPAVSTMPAANTTYTALYEADIYTITWLNANGASLGTTKVEYGATPTHDNPSLGATGKESYVFAGWEPALAPAEGNTTYTAVYTRTILTSMALALKSASYDRETGAITILATIVNPGLGGETTGEIVTAPATDGNTVTIEDGTNVTATIVKPLSRKGYEWTLSVTQLASGVSETATIKGRSWARNQRDWFAESDVSWTGGEYAPGSSSSAQQQVRVNGSLSFADILPNALPDAAGAKLGFAACQKNAGDPASYYAWNGSQWVKLVGVLARGGVAVNLLGVVDFARKDGPAVAWYADGFQLTTEAGDWEVPLAGGANLESFKRVGDFSVDSLSGDYDIGGVGFRLLVR